MSSTDLVRWSGLAALVGSVLIIATDLLNAVLFQGEHGAEIMTASSWFIIQILTLVGLLIITMGLPGLYAQQAKQTGTLGFISFIVTFSGMLMAFGLLWSEPFLGSYMAEIAPDVLEAEASGVLLIGVVSTLVLFAAGWFLFGLAALRAEAWPRGATILLMVGALLFFVLQFLELPFWSVTLGLALAWIGYTVWSGAATEAAPSAKTA